MSNKELIEAYATKMTAKGWIVQYQTDNTLNLVKPKKWNRLLLIAGLVLLPVYGIGILVLILAGVDFVMKPERRLNVTADELCQGEPPIQSDWSTPVVLGVLLIAALLACITIVFLAGLFI